MKNVHPLLADVLETIAPKPTDSTLRYAIIRGKADATYNFRPLTESILAEVRLSVAKRAYQFLEKTDFPSVRDPRKFVPALLEYIASDEP